jgi:hypothetical protein
MYTHTTFGTIHMFWYPSNQIKFLVVWYNDYVSDWNSYRMTQQLTNAISP